jgi:hypothetical protein
VRLKLAKVVFGPVAPLSAFNFLSHALLLRWGRGMYHDHPARYKHCLPKRPFGALSPPTGGLGFISAHRSLGGRGWHDPSACCPCRNLVQAWRASVSGESLPSQISCTPSDGLRLQYK